MWVTFFIIMATLLLVTSVSNRSSWRSLADFVIGISIWIYLTQGEVPGCEYFITMDPQYLLQIVGAFLAFAPSEPQSQGTAISPVLLACANILTPLTFGAPGLLEALYLFAKVKFLSGMNLMFKWFSTCLVTKVSQARMIQAWFRLSLSVSYNI